MSTAASPQSSPKISKISEAVIRIAGNSQDGIQAIGGFLARLAVHDLRRTLHFPGTHWLRRSAFGR
jgi:2-oxoglutarate ferredoxin oxidoreductase subunit alpha